MKPDYSDSADAESSSLVLPLLAGPEASYEALSTADVGVSVAANKKVGIGLLLQAALDQEKSHRLLRSSLGYLANDPAIADLTRALVEQTKLLKKKAISLAVDLAPDEKKDLFFTACYTNQYKFIDHLLASNPELISSRDGLGCSGLHHAALSGNPIVCIYLVQKGSEINQASPKGFTSLHVAAQEGKDAVCAVLLAMGAEPNTRCDIGAKYTPLNSSAAHGHVAVAQYLLAFGAALESKMSLGDGTRTIARRNGHPEFITAINSFGTTAQESVRIKSKILLDSLSNHIAQNLAPDTKAVSAGAGTHTHLSGDEHGAGAARK